MSENEQDWSNPLVAGFGTATAEDPPYPAQQHLDATDGEVVNPPFNVTEGDGTTHTVAADGEHVDHPEGFAHDTRSGSGSGGNSRSRKSASAKKTTSKKTAASKSGDDD